MDWTLVIASQNFYLSFDKISRTQVSEVYKSTTPTKVSNFRADLQSTMNIISMINIYMRATTKIITLFNPSFYRLKKKLIGFLSIFLFQQWWINYCQIKKKYFNTLISHLLYENKVPEVLRRCYSFQGVLSVYFRHNVDVHC